MAVRMWLALAFSVAWAQQATDLTNDERVTARRLYPGEITYGLLNGRTPGPPGFDRAMAERLGQERFDALRTGGENITGGDHDAAAAVLLRLKADPEKLKPSQWMTVRFVRSNYPVAHGNTSGFFRTGQDADILLSGIDFNNAGGPLLFNHPMGIATDGKRLLLADTYNNRVLIWNTLPSANVPPDLVLGQKDFTGNDSGTGRDQMNFPVNVTTDGQRIVVTDTDNYRILIWNQFPTRNGAPADVVLQGGVGTIDAPMKRNFHWPWGVWTDGRKLAISSTGGGWILIWNRFPTQDDQPADLLLRGGGKLGTPRQITSDGTHLIVGDHNPRMGGPGGGTFFWKTFPTRDDQPYDFYRGGDFWLRGCFTREGRLLLMSGTLHIWNTFPANEKVEPDLSLGSYNFWAGDHTGVAVAGDRVYIVTGNANKIVVYRSMPTKRNQLPDFAIGNPDIHTNTLETHFIISNPLPASNGKSLFVASGFDGKLYVWKHLPDRSGAHPDLVYSFTPGDCDIALWKDTLALAGGKTVRIWKKLPLDGNLPDVILDKRIGSVQLEDIRGVALDDRYFYLADNRAGKVYVWNGIPSNDSEPVMTLNVEQAWMLSSDGNYLAVSTCFRHMVLVYPVNELRTDAQPRMIGQRARDGRPVSVRFNGVAKALVAGGHLFIAEGFNRVHAWRRIEDACAGQRADAILGQPDFDSVRPGTGRNRLHTVSALSFDGSYLWAGEVKFSERLLRFSPVP